ncbi:hypothetical protein [uncultured Litoreibacter sp.]|uniref:hypothetical protein n=1 Tax=uncultured Litoreibacter sp. TaxID=1392394 RepID=UPI0026338142|nr:hypothetical protein [uncultured Litoreibacter sp.]
MSMFRVLGVAIVGAVAPFFATAVAAQSVPTLTQCQLGGKPSGIIAPEIAFSVAPDGKTATVSDVVTLRFEGRPAPAKVTRNTKRKLGLSWKVNNVRDARGNVAVAIVYRAVLTKATGVLNVSASPLGFSETFSRRGKCRTNSAAETAALTDKIKRASRSVKRQGNMPWGISAQRKFACSVPRTKQGSGQALPDWAFTAFRVDHDTTQSVAQVTASYGNLGVSSRSRAKFTNRHKFGYVSYRWQASVVSKQKRKAGESAKVTMEVRLRVGIQDSKAELVIDGHKSRRLQTFSLNVDCKPI